MLLPIRRTFEHTTMTKDKNLEFFSPDFSSMEIPLMGEAVAGFPSPAEDFIHEEIDLNRELVKNPEATFYVRVRGNSMLLDFQDGDLLIIDKSLDVRDNSIILCYTQNEFTLKRIKKENGKCYLLPSNPDFPVIETIEDVIVWGVVCYSIKKHR